jgi:hypothetical protein
MILWIQYWISRALARLLIWVTGNAVVTCAIRRGETLGEMELTFVSVCEGEPHIILIMKDRMNEGFEKNAGKLAKAIAESNLIVRPKK